MEDWNWERSTDTFRASVKGKRQIWTLEDHNEEGNNWNAERLVQDRKILQSGKSSLRSRKVHQEKNDG